VGLETPQTDPQPPPGAIRCPASRAFSTSHLSPSFPTTHALLVLTPAGAYSCDARQAQSLPFILGPRLGAGCARPRLPPFLQALDAGVRLQSRSLGSALQSLLPGYSNPKPRFRTTYVDSYMRVSRDQVRLKHAAAAGGSPLPAAAASCSSAQLARRPLPCACQDGKLFVYVRSSNSTSPTDYSQAAADLGMVALAASLAQIWS
jgi:hypothetical protein